MGLIICYQCGTIIGSHPKEGDSHGLCPSCHQQAMEEARKAVEEYKKRK